MHGSFLNSPNTNLTIEFLLHFYLRLSPIFLCPVHEMEITPLEHIWARALSSFSWAWQLPLQITSHLPQLSDPLPLCMLLTHWNLPWNSSILVLFLSPSSFCIWLGVNKSAHFFSITFCKVFHKIKLIYNQTPSLLILLGPKPLSSTSFLFHWKERHFPASQKPGQMQFCFSHQHLEKLLQKLLI